MRIVICCDLFFDLHVCLTQTFFFNKIKVDTKKPQKNKHYGLDRKKKKNNKNK